MAASGSTVGERLAKAYDDYTAARKISLVHLAGQFVERGSNAADQKHEDPEKPLLTRAEAFSRLYCRLDNVEENAEFKSYVDKLIAKENQATSYEKVVVGLVYRFGCWEIPRNYVTAQQYFREAFEADATNSYAQVLYAYMNYHLSADAAVASREKAIASFEDVVANHREAEGLAYMLLGVPLEDASPASANDYYSKAIALKFAMANRFFAMYLKRQEKNASRDKYYEAALTQGDMSALVYYFLDHVDAAKNYFVLEAATHGNHLAAFYAAAHEKQAPVLTASHYRWSLALRPSWDLNFKVRAHKYFKLLVDVKAVEYGVLYHYGMAFNELDSLSGLLTRDLGVFVRLWKDDYCSDRSSVMKKQAIDFILGLNPKNFPAKIILLLAEAIKNCSEADLKVKFVEFQKAAADLKTNVSVDALTALSVIRSPSKMPKGIGSSPAQPVNTKQRKP